ncbi:MAG: hypothetical protein LC634_07400 [Sphingomonadales bacterium]|nr:hypothetical protein [Sphingomonadales bacterium]
MLIGPSGKRRSLKAEIAIDQIDPILVDTVDQRQLDGRPDGAYAGCSQRIGRFIRGCIGLKLGCRLLAIWLDILGVSGDGWRIGSLVRRLQGQGRGRDQQLRHDKRYDHQPNSSHRAPLLLTFPEKPSQPSSPS